MTSFYLFAAAFVIAGWIVVYFGSRRALQRACADLRLELLRQIDSLAAHIRQSGPSTVPEVTPEQQDMAATEEITPEILRKITETITALLGRKVHIRSVKILRTHDTVSSSWAQQGRVVVQASHNLAQRGHDL
jgi:hypothetical protein